MHRSMKSLLYTPTCKERHSMPIATMMMRGSSAQYLRRRVPYCTEIIVLRVILDRHGTRSAIVEMYKALGCGCL